MTRTLFVSFEVGVWTNRELSALNKEMENVVPEDVNVAIVPEDIEYLSVEEVQEMIETLKERTE